MSKQPRDDANAPIPVLAYRTNGGQQISLGVSSARSAAVANNVRVVTIYSTVDCFFEVGDDAVEANGSTSHFLPAGLPYDISLGSETVTAQNPRYIAFIAGESGTLYLSERI